MKATGEASAVGWHHRLTLWLRPRGLLVATQVALSLILLPGAALLIESLAGLSRVQPGFEPRNLLSMEITLPQPRHRELVRRVESIPGVEAAAITLTLPMTGYVGTPVQAAGQPPLEAKRAAHRHPANCHPGILAYARHPDARWPRLRA